MNINKESNEIIERQLTDIEIICAVLDELPENIEDIIDGDDERTDFCETRGKDCAYIAETLEEINEGIISIKELCDKLNTISDNLLKIKNR